MPFSAKTFIFDDIPSEFYNLYIGEINGGGESSMKGSDVELITEKIYRRPKPYLLGVEQKPVLEFEISTYVPGFLTAETYSTIAGWLFGQQRYKVLRLCQNDMQDVYFNAFFTSPEIIRVGNLIRGFKATIVCDAPWGYKNPKTYTYNNYVGYSMSDTVEFFNESANSAYTYPSDVTIVGNIFGGSVTITNVTDNNRQFIYNIARKETVSFDNDLQIVTSDKYTYPLVYFNKRWLRFVRGYNLLTFSGNITSVSITTPPIEVKIG